MFFNHLRHYYNLLSFLLGILHEFLAKGFPGAASTFSSVQGVAASINHVECTYAVHSKAVLIIISF